jgi:lipoprotein-anchoring transpeptidase ErfK/SrfK
MGHFRRERLGRTPQLLLTAFMLAVLMLSSIGAVSAQGEATAPRKQLYFTQTGQTVNGPFLAYWLSQQSVERTGLPITPSVKHDDRWTQWFEYTRLEVHHFTGIESGVNVHVARLGQDYADSVGYTTWHPAFKPVKDPGDGTVQFFPETGHTLSGGFHGTWHEPGVASQLGQPISEEFSSNGTIYQFFEYGALSWSAAAGTRFVPLGTLDAALNNQLGLTMPRPNNAVDYPYTAGLLTTDAFSTERWIEISLSEFRLTAYVGDIPFLSSSIVTGADQSPTVLGTFQIWHKNRMQDMSGIGWDGRPYFEANVPWAMYFYRDYAIHGTTWRQTYGVRGSQGCVLPPNHIAEILFNWADIGTRVVVKP